jgi:hypothetical protein
MRDSESTVLFVGTGHTVAQLFVSWQPSNKVILHLVKLLAIFWTYSLQGGWTWIGPTGFLRGCSAIAPIRVLPRLEPPRRVPSLWLWLQQHAQESRAL